MQAQDAWRESSGQAWVKLQAQTDAQLEPLGRPALDRLQLEAGERVLDVGCGAGQSCIELAVRVGATGTVVGVDISEPMVTAARGRVAQAGLGNVEIILGDAARQTFEVPFDAIYSRFGVMFFPDAVAAFREMRESLRPSGRLAFVCWQELERNDWAHVPLMAARSVSPDHPMPALLQPGQPGPFYFSAPAFVQQVLGAAGFKRVNIEPRETMIQLGAARDIAEAVEYSMQIGPSARFMADTDPSLKPAFQRALSEALRPFASNTGVWMAARSLVVTASSS